MVCVPIGFGAVHTAFMSVIASMGSRWMKIGLDFKYLVNWEPV